MKNQKHIIIILIIIILILLAGVGYLVYDKVYVNKATSSLAKEEILVIDAVNLSSGKKMITENVVGVDKKYEINIQTFEVDVKLPKLNIDKPGAIAINNKIMTDYKMYLDMVDAIKNAKSSTLEEEQQQIKDAQALGYETFKIKYTYTRKDNIIFLIINSSGDRSESSGIPTTNSSYAYNITDDKEMTYIDLKSYFNITDKAIEDKIKDKYPIENYPDEIKEHVEWIKDAKKTPLYINDKGEIVIETSGFNKNIGVVELIFEK